MIDKDAVIDAVVVGVSRQKIALRHECSERDIDAILNTYAAEQLTPANRAAAVVIEASRIDHLQRRFLRQAIEQGDVAAGTLCCKLGQRKAALLGLDQPSAVRMDLSVVTPYRETSTQELTRIVWQLKHPGEEYQPPADPE